MSLDRIIRERKDRWNNFLAGRTNAGNIVLISYLEGLESKPFIRDGKYQDLSDWVLKKYSIMKENLNWLPDDSIPYLDTLTGTEIFAEAFGCKVIYPRDNNPFALHKISDTSEIAGLKVPELWDSRLSDLFEWAYKLRERSEKDAVLRLPDIQSPLDIAALIMNKEDFYIGLVEEPEAINELISKTDALLTRFLDEWFKAFGKDFIAHYPDYYMEYGITLSEDEVGVISRRTFDEMALENLNKLSDRYGRIGIHCCARSRHQWDSMRKLRNLCLLNIAQPKEIVMEAYEFFRDTCAQMHSYYGDGEISTWKSQIPDGARVVFQLQADKRDDALKELENLRKI